MMLKKSYIYLILTVVALLAAACSKAPELTEPSVPVPDMTNIITFDMLGTKVTNDDITNEEFIIYDYVDGSLYIDGSNYTLKYSDSEEAWRFFDSSGNVKDFYWTETGTHEFFAYNKVDYYSYNSQVDNWKVNFTFDDQNKCLRTDKVIKMLYFNGKYEDLIYANTTRDVESEDGYAPVEIHFNHMFASVKVTFRNNSLTKKTISDISLTNLYCSTDAGSVLYFNGSQDLSLGDANPYEFSVSQEVYNETEWDAFGTVIVLPQELGGMTEEVVWHEGGVEKRLHIYNDLGTDYWYAGKLYHYVITLDPTELSLEPTATIEHIEDDGGNKVSVVNVNLNAPVEELPRITDLVFTVTYSQGTYQKTHVLDNVESNEIRLECGVLLNPGAYTVSVDYSVAYHDGSESLSDSMTVVLEDTAVQPAVGYYVNSDGTFSETFVSGESIAKIFWIDSLSSDTQLVSDYPYLTAEGTDHGLAYEVDETTGNLKELSGTGWGKGTYSAIGSNNAYYDSINNWNGYSCTFIIQQVSTSGFINQNIGEGYQVCPNTSSWFIPSIAEIEAVIQSGVTPSTNLLWTSTMYSGYFGQIECYTYNWSTDMKTRQTATAAYLTNKYFRILAF